MKKRVPGFLKSRLYLLLSFCVLYNLSTVVPSEAQAPVDPDEAVYADLLPDSLIYVQGDANWNGAVNSNDVNDITKWLSGGTLPSASDMIDQADINMDGLITIADTLALTNFLNASGPATFNGPFGQRTIGWAIPPADRRVLFNPGQATTPTAQAPSPSSSPSPSPSPSPSKPANEKDVPADTPTGTPNPLSCIEKGVPGTWAYNRGNKSKPYYPDAQKVKSTDAAKGETTLSLALSTVDRGDKKDGKKRPPCGVSKVVVKELDTGKELMNKQYACPGSVQYHVDVTVKTPTAKGSTNHTNIYVTATDCAYPANTGNMPFQVQLGMTADGKLQNGYGGIMPDDPATGGEMSEGKWTPGTPVLPHP